MKKDHLPAGARESDKAAEQDRSGVMLTTPADACERINARRDHGECPDDVDERLGETVIGGPTGEGTPHPPEAGGHQREDQSGVTSQRNLARSPQAASTFSSCLTKSKENETIYPTLLFRELSLNISNTFVCVKNFACLRPELAAFYAGLARL